MSDQASQTSDEYRRRIFRAIDYINANLAKNPSVTEIARAAPFSPFHFQRLFRAWVGESVAEFTRRVRLESAARRLVFRPGDDVTKIAFALGFSSSQNFAKAFQKQFGMSATRYRSQHGQAPSTETNHEKADVFLSRNQLVDQSLSKDMMSNVKVKALPSISVVYRRHLGSYQHPGVERAFADLSRWAEPRGFDELERYLGIPWDDANITPDDKCRFDACLVIPDHYPIDKTVNRQTIPAAKYAVYSCEVVHHDFDLPWTRLMRDWLPNSGHQPADGPRFEVYHSDGGNDPEGRWSVDVCLPVVPLGSYSR